MNLLELIPDEELLEDYDFFVLFGYAEESEATLREIERRGLVVKTEV